MKCGDVNDDSELIGVFVEFLTKGISPKYLALLVRTQIDMDAHLIMYGVSIDVTPVCRKCKLARVDKKISTARHE